MKKCFRQKLLEGKKMALVDLDELTLMTSLRPDQSHIFF